MSQKTDNLIKLALVFFVSLLSFSIGTYVGKKYSDNQHKLALLEPKKEQPAVKSDEFASDTTEVTKNHGLVESENLNTHQKPVALTDSEVAKIAEEFAAEDMATEEKLVATLEPQETVVKTIPDSAVKLPVAKPKVVAEERIPASINTKKDVAPIHFTVQIGSFPTQSEAESMTKDLQGKGFKTTYVPVKLNGQLWYRVNVGLFGTVKEAQDYKKEFLEKTKLTTAIVQRVL